MIPMNKNNKNSNLIFGVSGIPPDMNSEEANFLFRLLKDSRLKCAEISFVQGPGVKTKNIALTGKAAKENNILLSSHAPYFMNLNARENSLIRKSMMVIYETARLSHIMKADSVVFHPGFYMKETSEKVLQNIYERVKKIRQYMTENNINVILRPETMGNRTQFGTVDELLNLCESIEGVMPCFDFSHIHARSGNDNTYEEFQCIFETIEKKLGKEGLKNMHCHISGIEYTNLGEKKHTHLMASDMNYTDLMKVFYEFKAKGRIICESPDPYGDACLLKYTYKTFTEI